MNKLLLCVLLAGLCLPAGAETYKCVVKGKVTYTNRMPADSTKCEVMGRKKGSSNTRIDAPAASGDEGGAPAAGGGTAKPAAAAAQADKEQAAKKKKADAEEAKKKEDEKQAQQKLKEQNCSAAKVNYEAMKSGRVRKFTEKGEPYYLNDAEIAQGLADANKEVESWCN